MAAPSQNSSWKIIPTVWREKILKRDFNIVLGKMLQSAQETPNETEEFYLRSANIQWDGVDLSDVKTMWFSDVEKRQLLLCPSDLLVNEGGDAGRCTIWQGELDQCYFQNAINRVRPRNLASTKFLYYWLYNLKHAGFIDAIISRTTIAHLTAEKLERIPWPDVSSVEQQRIATYLDASCAAIDGAVAAKKKQVGILEELHRRMLHEAFEFRKNLKIERIKDISTKIGSGVTPQGGATNYLNEGIPLLRSQNVHFDRLRIEDVAYISAETHAEMIGSQLQEGDVLVNITGASIGRVCFVPKGFGEANVNQHVCIIRPRHLIHHQFLAYFLASPKGQSQIFSSFTGASRQGLSHSELGVIELPLTSINEQITIIDQIKSETIKRNKIKSNLENQINTLTAYRKSLIHECVTGQRRITEADSLAIRQQAKESSHA